MNDLFYSNSEGVLFWIAGYSTYNFQEVKALVKELEEGANKFAKLLPQNETNEIRTFRIEKSRIYQDMRVFYVETTTIPKNAIQLGKDGDWTMLSWVQQG